MIIPAQGKSKSAVFLILTLAAAALYLLIGYAGLDDYLFLEFDSPIYIILARSLALGEGFVDISLPGSPPECSRYPLYPLVLLPAAWLYPLEVVPAKVVSYLVSFAALACFFFFLKKSFGRWWALGGAAALAFNPFILFRYALQPLGEYLYVLIVLAFALWYFSGSREETSPGWKEYLLLGLFFTAAALWKENGLALPFAYLFYRWRRGQARRADYLLVLLPLLFAAAWAARNAFLYRASPIGWPSHLQEIGGRFSGPAGGIDGAFIVRSLLHNSAYYFLALPRLLFSTFFLRGFMFGDCFPGFISLAGRRVFTWPAAVLAYSLAVPGWRMYRPFPQRFFLSSWAALYLVTIVVFPASEIRMVFIILPVFLLFFIRGLKAVSDRGGMLKIAASVFLILLVLLSLSHSILIVFLTPAEPGRPGPAAALARTLRFRPGQCRYRYREAGEWLRENTSPGEPAASDSSTVFLFSERRIAPLDIFFSPETPPEDREIRYAVLKGSFGLPFIESRLRMNPWYRFRRRKDFGNVLVYEARRKSEPGVSLQPPREEYLEAIVRARRELALYPRDPYLHHEIGMLRFALREFAEALDYLEEAVRLQPRAITLTLSLARCYMLTGRYDRAEELLLRARGQEVFQRSYEKVEGLLNLNELHRELSRRMNTAGRKRLLMEIAAVNSSLGYRIQTVHSLKEARALDPADREIPRILAEHFGVVRLEEEF